jgi:hypothetical protein
MRRSHKKEIIKKRIQSISCKLVIYILRFNLILYLPLVKDLQSNLNKSVNSHKLNEYYPSWPADLLYVIPALATQYSLSAVIESFAVKASFHFKFSTPWFSPGNIL